MTVHLVVSNADPARAPAEHVPPFREVYDTYFDYVWRCARRLGVSSALLDDASQDVFVVVHRRLAEFEGRSSLRTWLFGIVLRVARDYRRRAQRRDLGESLNHEPIDPAPGPLDSATTAEALRQLLTALDRLDEDKREVFVLAELEQMTAPEIAEVIGIPLNTVYSRLRVARASIEAAFAPREGEAR